MASRLIERSWLIGRLRECDGSRGRSSTAEQPPSPYAPCPVCGETVTKDQLEIEAEFAHDGSSPGLDRFHIHCDTRKEAEVLSAGAVGYLHEPFNLRDLDRSIALALGPLATGG
jgi:hypothetical protein